MNEYNNTYYSTIKMKPVDKCWCIYIGFGKDNNDKDPKMEVGEYAVIPKYINIFAKVYTRNWTEEVFVD